MKPYNCTKCQFFNLESNPNIGENSGSCRRKAPHGYDANGSQIAQAINRFYQAGVVSDTLFSEEPVYLYKNQFELLDEASPLPVSKGTAQGFAENEVSPFLGYFSDSVYQISIVAARLNTGAATVGTNPILKVSLLNYNLTTANLISTIEVPIPTAVVGAFGNGLDNLVRVTLTFDTPIAFDSRSFGFEIDLDTTSSEDYIAQARNVQVLLGNKLVKSQGWPWGIVVDSTTFWCGKFKPLGELNPNANCWKCDYFNPLNPGVDNSGQCRFYAPSGLDNQSIPGFISNSAIQPDRTYEQTVFSDGTDTVCGDFKPSTTTVPDPV